MLEHIKKFFNWSIKRVKGVHTYEFYTGVVHHVGDMYRYRVRATSREDAIAILAADLLGIPTTKLTAEQHIALKNAVRSEHSTIVTGEGSTHYTNLPKCLHLAFSGECRTKDDRLRTTYWIEQAGQAIDNLIKAEKAAE